VFLAVGLVFSVVLLGLRVDALSAEGRLGGGASREGAFLVNNLLLVLFTFTVLLGTVFPLVVEAWKGVQMSVGRPYFDRMAVPIGTALLFLMGVGPALPWGAASGAEMRRALLAPVSSGVVLAGLGALLGARNAWTLVTLAFGGYAAHVTLAELLRPAALRVKGGEPWSRALLELPRAGARRRFGGYVVHAAVVVIIIAIAVSSTMGSSREVQLRQGESIQLGRYTLTFLRAEETMEPHRQVLAAVVGVKEGGRDAGVLRPSMNQYGNQREPIGTPAVRTSWREDLYLSALNIDPRGGSVGLLALVNPMVAWIWVATAVMGLGGLLAVFPARTSRARVPEARAVPAHPAAEASR
jgi:cytochrome c-type biogenesis protein CcmF